jgi:hypothetical protein
MLCVQVAEETHNLSRYPHSEPTHIGSKSGKQTRRHRAFRGLAQNCSTVAVSCITAGIGPATVEQRVASGKLESCEQATLSQPLPKYMTWT